MGEDVAALAKLHTSASSVHAMGSLQALPKLRKDHHLTIHTPHVAAAEPASSVPGPSLIELDLV